IRPVPGASTPVRARQLHFVDAATATPVDERLSDRRPHPAGRALPARRAATLLQRNQFAARVVEVEGIHRRALTEDGYDDDVMHRIQGTLRVECGVLRTVPGPRSGRAVAVHREARKLTAGVAAFEPEGIALGVVRAPAAVHDSYWAACAVSPLLRSKIEERGHAVVPVVVAGLDHQRDEAVGAGVIGDLAGGMRHRGRDVRPDTAGHREG